MSAWEQLIAVRERQVSECIDLALPLWRGHWQPLLFMSVISYIPWALIAFVSSNMIGGEHWHKTAWIYLILLVGLPAQTAPLSVFLGRAQFKQPCHTATAFKEWGRRWTTWFVAVQLPYCLYAATPAVLLLMNAQIQTFASITVINILVCAIIMSLINNEVVLLEAQQYQASRKRIRSLSKSRHAHTFKWFASLILIGVLLLICAGHGLHFLVTTFSLGHGQIDSALSYINPHIHYAPWIIWPILTSFFACCTFLAYTNLRTCSEGWALEHRLRAAADHIGPKGS